jgi:hypothetical protein
MNSDILQNTKKVDYLKSKEYYLFQINDFLTEQFYKDFKSNFPLFSSKELSKEIFLNQRNGKFAFNSDMEIYHNLLKKNIHMQELHKTVMSQEFLDHFYKILKKKFINSKRVKFFDLIKVLKKPVLDDPVSWKKFFLQKIRITLEYSYILNDGKIVPHTDNPTKLLSLMLYFPDNDADITKERALGTVFWSSKIKNYHNIHQFGDLETKFIENKENNIFKKLPFLGKNLYGFIKNESSWHSVDPVKMDSQYVRKSININFHF